jgi:hypothetical protein
MKWMDVFHRPGRHPDALRGILHLLQLYFGINPSTEENLYERDKLFLTQRLARLRRVYQLFSGA